MDERSSAATGTLPEPYGNLLESFTTLSYLAARTQCIGLATGILALRRRDPLLAAKQAAATHHLSGARLSLGVGVGWIEQEYAYLRSDFRSRGHIAAIRELFESGAPEFHGAHINYFGVLLSPRPSPPCPSSWVAPVRPRCGAPPCSATAGKESAVARKKWPPR